MPNFLLYIYCVWLLFQVVENIYQKGVLVCEGESNIEERKKEEEKKEEEKKEEEKNEEIDDVNKGNELETIDDKVNIGKWYKLGIIYVGFFFYFITNQIIRNKSAKKSHLPFD